jgi:cellulose synthase/poly-beta-1,6-N-acetylglucosamine synthase-like glycosyltransferase
MPRPSASTPQALIHALLVVGAVSHGAYVTSTMECISVVIPACDEEAVIGECLQSLLSQDFDGAVQVVVVANGCTDATVELARSYQELSAR